MHWLAKTQMAGRKIPFVNSEEHSRYHAKMSSVQLDLPIWNLGDKSKLKI
jgi:hypothetical protein